MDAPAIRRQLKIKVGAMKRLNKENGLYKKEVEELKKKQDKLTAEKAEEWDIKNAGKMLEESSKLVTDSGTRRDKAAGELRDLVALAKQKAEMNGDDELVKAEEALKEVE
ncbi:tubulin binding cofactor A [Amanita rubescens]|nr:tubulin binding cofactor A [Amanita rubescens]